MVAQNPAPPSNDFFTRIASGQIPGGAPSPNHAAGIPASGGANGGMHKPLLGEASNINSITLGAGFQDYLQFLKGLSGDIFSSLGSSGGIFANIGYNFPIKYLLQLGRLSDVANARLGLGKAILPSQQGQAQGQVQGG